MPSGVCPDAALPTCRGGNCVIDVQLFTACEARSEHHGPSAIHADDGLRHRRNVDAEYAYPSGRRTRFLFGRIGERRVHGIRAQ